MNVGKGVFAPGRWRPKLCLVFNEAISIAAIALQHHKDLGELVLRLWDRLTRGHKRIIVIGAAGAGKSSLGRLLSGEGLGDGAYRESTEVENYAFGGATSCTVLVPPGQERLRDATWSGLEGFIRSGSNVVVHVVDWGLDEIAPLSFSQLKQYQEGMQPSAVLEAFAANRREQEIATVDWLLEVKPKDDRLRLVTVATKQDLWWRWRDRVRDHYESGPYAAAIASLEQRLGQGNLHHSLWSVAQISKNLRDGDGEVLLPTTEGYDEPRRKWHERRLLEIMGEAAKSA